MISKPVEAALLALQQQALSATDDYQLSRIERALDELLRNPEDETTPAAYRVRSAMGHAYEALERRKEIAPSTSLNTEIIEHGEFDSRYTAIEILLWLDHEPALGRERELLCDLAQGYDSGTIARKHAVPVPRIRERISRARRTAKKLWAEAA